MSYIQTILQSNNDNLIISFYFLLSASILSCLFFLLKVKDKIQRIQSKDSYCVISIWINVIAAINLTVQLGFNAYHVIQIFHPTI